MRVSSSKTVDRLVKILDSFSREKPSWSLTELSVELGLPKATLHRFLIALEQHNLTWRNAVDKRWHLGYRLTIWGRLATQCTGLQHLAREALEELVAATGEMSLLTVYEDRMVICVDKVESRHSVRLALDVGKRQCPHAGASSKILMAYLPEAEIQTIIEKDGLTATCVNAITDAGKLRAELAKIRAQGFAMSVEETDLGAWGVATPIFDRNGDVIASIGVAGPTLRFTEELSQRYVELCRQASERISSILINGNASQVPGDRCLVP